MALNYNTVQAYVNDKLSGDFANAIFTENHALWAMVRQRQKEFNERTELFMNALNVDEMVGQVLASEGFSQVEEVAYVDLDEIASIEGFDDETIWSITSTACFSAGANRMAQSIGLKPAPEYLDMYRTPATAVASAG